MSREPHIKDIWEVLVFLSLVMFVLGCAAGLALGAYLEIRLL